MAHKVVCVTGANGFIASWIVFKLLQKGYTVHGTVRNLENCKHLEELDGAKERLHLFKADVVEYHALLPAIRGCHGVFHTACPVTLKIDASFNSADVLLPAIQGTQNVLKACSAEKIKKVVMTSSGAAIAMDPKRPQNKTVDESCWSDSDFIKERKIWYALAKVDSERLAWDLSRDHKLDLVVICPAMVFGPILQPRMNATVEYLVALMKDSSYHNLWMQVVDVRDVADVHVAAFEDETASGRYFCFEDTLHLREMVKILCEKFPQHCNPDIKCDESMPTQGIPPGLVSNVKMKSLIKEMIPCEQTLADTIDCP